MNTTFKIKKGLQRNLPSSKEEGVAYVCTDTGNVYADLDEKRIQLTHFEKTQEGGYISEDANGAKSHAFAIGMSCSAAEQSVALGNKNNVNIENSVAIGVNNTINQFDSQKRTSCIALGQDNVVAGKANTAIGLGLISNRQHNGGVVLGKYNVESGDIFTIGAGTSDGSRINLLAMAASGSFRIRHATDNISQMYMDGQGNLNVRGTYKTGLGADYAEYFEWEDNNINSENRTGRFVTLSNNKIKLANKADDVIGIISSTAGMIGNAYELEWQGRFLKDEFGAIIYEDIINEDGEEEKRPIENPDYDPTQVYVPRSERPEWAIVGFMGQIVMLHDGTCEVNGYCAPGVDGIATSSSEKTNCRVMKRIDDTHILVLLK